MKMFIYVQDNHDILFYLLVDIYYPIISGRGQGFIIPLHTGFVASDGCCIAQVCSLMK